MPKLKIRKARKRDCRAMFQWLNDPGTRNSRFSSVRVTFPAHKKWFYKSLDEAKRKIYVAVNDEGSLVGQVRMDEVNDRAYELDITVSPDYRGHGYGTEMIRLISSKMLNRMSSVLFLARIKEFNAPSVRSFCKAGFIKIFNYFTNSNDKVGVWVKWSE